MPSSCAFDCLFRSATVLNNSFAVESVKKRKQLQQQQSIYNVYICIFICRKRSCSATQYIP